MKMILSVMIFGTLILSACTSDIGNSENKIQTDSSASWVYQFVKWENESYVVTEEEVNKDNIGAEIGEVTFYSDEESADTSGNFSNVFEEGTKYYEITNIDKKEAIAIKVEEEKFIKAIISDTWKEKKL